MRLGVGRALVDGRFVRGDVEVKAGRVSAVGVGSGGDKNLIALPGFVDIQVNGFAGTDFGSCDPEDFEMAGDALATTGVVAYLPTVITSSIDQTKRALDVIGEARERGLSRPKMLGAHLEGPFLAQEYAGAHPVEHLREPDQNLMVEFLSTPAPVRMVTLAPELPGAIDLIKALTSSGVVVSIGHTDANTDVTKVALDSGASAVTHLFNAMRPFAHRDPGVVGAALTRADVAVGLIVDGVHVASETVEVVRRCAGDRVYVVTDAISAALSGRSGSLGAVEITVEGRAPRSASGVLAGGVGTMDEALRELVRLGLPIGQALRWMSEFPRRVLGLRAESLEPGSPASLVVVDDNLQVKSTLVGGIWA